MIFPWFLVNTKNTLLSGNLRNQGLLKRRAAAVDLSKLLAMLLSCGFAEPKHRIQFLIYPCLHRIYHKKTLGILLHISFCAGWKFIKHSDFTKS